MANAVGDPAVTGALAENRRAARQQRGMTQEALGDACNLRPAAIARPADWDVDRLFE